VELGGCERLAKLPHSMAILSMAISADGKTLASGSGNKNPDAQILAPLKGELPNYVMLWDIASRTKRASLKGNPGRVDALAFTSDGNLLATGGALDRAVRLWDLDTNSELRMLKHPEQVYAVVIALDNRMLVSGGGWAPFSQEYKDAIILWDLITGRKKATLKGHSDGVTCVAITGDEQILATGSRDRTVKLWDIQP
jgi:WD40 repeat protein